MVSPHGTFAFRFVMLRQLMLVCMIDDCGRARPMGSSEAAHAWFHTLLLYALFDGHANLTPVKGKIMN